MLGCCFELSLLTHELARGLEQCESEAAAGASCDLRLIQQRIIFMWSRRGGLIRFRGNPYLMHEDSSVGGQGGHRHPTQQVESDGMHMYVHVVGALQKWL